LGPLDVARLRALILSGHIVGTEQAREHPAGEWRAIASIPALAEMFLAHANGTLKDDQYSLSAAETPAVDLAAQTQILAEASPPAPPATPAEPTSARGGPPPVEPESGAGAALDLDGEDATQMVSGPALQEAEEEATRVGGFFPAGPVEMESGGVDLVPQRSVAHEKTVVFSRSTLSATLPGRAEGKGGAWTKQALLLGAAALMLVEAFLGGGAPLPSQVVGPGKIRPELPGTVVAGASPIKSEELYRKALAYYQEDTIPGYRRAVEILHQALRQDGQNVRALAMLASAYLNLIDVSNKDDTYFSVISKLVELSRAKGLDLAETLIAESEYLILTGRPLAAESRLIEHSKANKNYSELLKLYLVMAYLARGEYARAARFVVPIVSLPGVEPKLRYVRGLIAEGIGDRDAAVAEYRAVIKKSPRHAMARFRLAKLADGRNDLKSVKAELLTITKTADALPVKELAEAYALRSKLDQLEEHLDGALGNIERALRLAPENPEYNLNYFVLRARAGDSLPEIRKEARLYFYMAESERLLREGKTEEAQIKLMEARSEAPGNAQPLVRLGDLFYQHKSDILNARLTYKKAAQLAPSDIRIWGRYIELLIQSYEWDEANRALTRLRQLPVPQSSVDKAMADWYAKQGRHTEALLLYRKALSHDYIDPSVYIAFGKSLIESKNYEQAPFIFALAQRQDPNNMDAVVGTARAIQGTEGLDRAVSYLRDELQKGGATRAELLCAIADLLIQKGSWDEAMSFIEQAKAANPDLALPFKYQAQLFAARPNPLKSGGERKAKDKVLESYRAYLDRNPADPAIMFEKYRVLMDLGDFEAADSELQRIYEMYPRFPSLHYSKGLIYVRLSNFKAAQAEYEQEVRNGNNSAPVLLALGNVHLELKEPDKALKYFIEAMQRAPKEAEPKHWVGYANFLLKRYDAAVALYREALKLDAGNPIIYRRLGEAYRAMGDAGGARWAFQKYLEMEPDAADRAELQRYL